MARRVLVLGSALLLVACTASAPGPSTSAPTGGVPHPGAADAGGTARDVPRFAHIVVVVEENHSYRDVIGNAAAPYLNRLAATGTVLARAYGVTHPSQPNYLALFSGSTHGLTDDSCPHTYRGRNLAAQLLRRGQTFAGYAESLPRPGYLGCSSGSYVRRHAPWTDFANLPASLGRPVRALPAKWRRPPRVSIVIPNLDHDMHDGTIARADTWLRNHLAGYVRWARRHNSLLVVTWDEDDGSAANHIPGLLVGAHVQHLRYRGRVDHYRILRTVEAACGLPAIGAAARRTPIRAVWLP